MKRLEAWIKRLIKEVVDPHEVAMIGEIKRISPPVFDDTHLCEEVEQLEFRLRRDFQTSTEEIALRFHNMKDRFDITKDQLRSSIESFGAPISDEVELLHTYEAVTFAVGKVEGDVQLNKIENEHLQLPEAIQWTVHYLHERGWTSPGIANIVKLVEFKFERNREHRQTIYGVTV